MLEHLARLSLVGFLQRKQRRGFIIPSNSAPKSFAVPAHDFERAPPTLPDSNNGAASSAKRRRARAPQRSPRRSALELGLGYAMPRVKGSSPGFLCESIAEIVSRYGAVIGVDISSDLVARCKQRNQAEWLSYEVGDATQLALPNASFDVVVCTQVAECLPDVNRGLSETFRLVSKAAGVVSCNGLEAIVWHSETPDRMASLLKSWEAHCAHPSLPRSLGNRLVSAGFRLDGASVFPILNVQWDDAASDGVGR